MIQAANTLPTTGMMDCADAAGTPGDIDEQHPLAKALYDLLASPDDATIGELARLLESISGEMRFYASAIVAPATPDESGAQGAVVSHAELASTSGELDALGTLLQALEVAKSRRQASAI